MSVVEDRSRMIEESPLAKLSEVDIDEVYQHMDDMLERRPTPLDLYNRWERGNWIVADLDFSQDSQHWPLLMEGVREELFRIFTQFFIGEQAVTDTLSPLLIASPTEDDRIFLSTQVVDEARHTVFFKKFFAEVLGVSGGLAEAFDLLKSETDWGFKRIFDQDLVEATDACRLDPSDRVAWVRGLTIYHLVIEGMLALTGQKFLLRVFRNVGMMPGFRAGFTAVARDESRHVNYGVSAIRRNIVADPSMAEVVTDAVNGILEAAVKTVEPADRPYADVQHPNELPPPMRVDPREVYNFSIHSLGKRLRVAGLESQVVKDIESRGLSYYDEQIEYFEKAFDREHAIRHYERGEVELYYPEAAGVASGAA